MGWRNLFSSCAVVSVFFSGGKQVLVLHTPYVFRVTYSCGVVLVFFNLPGNSFWYVRTQCTIQLCGCVSFFVVVRKLIQYKLSCVTALQSRQFLKNIKTFYSLNLFLVFYRSTTLQSQSFLKNIDNFLCKQKLVNNHSIPLRQQPQNHDAFSKIQLRSFLKIIKNFLCRY